MACLCSEAEAYMKAAIMKTRKFNRENNEVSMREKPIKTRHPGKWTARIHLVLVFMIAILMCQGWLMPNEAQAARTIAIANGTGPANFSAGIGLQTITLMLLQLPLREPGQQSL